MLRPQFNLRALLVAVILLCFALGCRHIYVMYLASYVIADAKVGQPVVLRGQFFLFDGPDSMVLYLGVSERVAKPGRRLPTGRTFLRDKSYARRSGLGTYSFSKVMPDRWSSRAARWAPGKFDVFVEQQGEHRVIGHVVVEP
jgi:hypothetical protein